MAHDKTDHKSSRRQFVKKAVYITPAILSLAVASSYAKPGSRKGKHEGGDGKRNKDKGQEEALTNLRISPEVPGSTPSRRLRRRGLY